MEYFDKYKEAKMCLYKMVGRFYNCNLTIEEANELNLLYREDDIRHDNTIKVCFHQFDSEGLMLWEKLKLNKSFLTYEEIWTKRSNVGFEKSQGKDYYEDYLNTAILITDMVLKHYSTEMTKSEADKFFIKYDSDIDEYNNMVEVCEHIFESAGEKAWKFLEIEDPVIGRSVVENIRNNYQKKLIKIEKDKINKQGDYYE